MAGQPRQAWRRGLTLMSEGSRGWHGSATAAGVAQGSTDSPVRPRSGATEGTSHQPSSCWPWRPRARWRRLRSCDIWRGSGSLMIWAPRSKKSSPMPSSSIMTSQSRSSICRRCIRRRVRCAAQALTSWDTWLAGPGRYSLQPTARQRGASGWARGPNTAVVPGGGVHRLHRLPDHVKLSSSGSLQGCPGEAGCPGQRQLPRLPQPHLAACRPAKRPALESVSCCPF